MISSWKMTIFKQVSLMYFKIVDHTVNFGFSVIQTPVLWTKKKPVHGLVFFTAEHFAFFII